MTTLRRAACLAVMCLALSPPAAFAGTPAASAKQNALVGAINYARKAHGLAPLAASRHLMRSASGLAGHLMRSNWFGHAGPIEAGGGYRTLGEVLHLQRGTRLRYAATVRAWLASPGHRAVVLSPAFRHTGAGIAQGTFNGRSATIWVLHVGAY